MSKQYTEKATVVKIRPRPGHDEVQVMTEEDQLFFLVPMPWYKLNSYLIGMPVTITYHDSDQFATIKE